jgi:hypothetical protein
MDCVASFLAVMELAQVYWVWRNRYGREAGARLRDQMGGWGGASFSYRLLFRQKFEQGGMSSQPPIPSY